MVDKKSVAGAAVGGVAGAVVAGPGGAAAGAAFGYGAVEGAKRLGSGSVDESKDDTTDEAPDK